MTGLLRSGRALPLVGALLLAVVATFLDGALAPEIPLYNSELCPANPSAACHYPNTPRLPVIPILAGVAYGVILGRPSLASMLVGGAAGFGASLVADLFVAAAIPLRDPYFITLYRVYGLGYLAAFLGLLAFVVVRRGFVRRAPALWPVALAPFPAILASAARQDWIVAGTAVIALIVGSSAAILMPTLRWALPSASRIAIFFVAVAFVTRTAFGLLTLARTGPGMAFAIASDDGDSYYTFASRLARDVGQLDEVFAGLAFPPAYTSFLAAIFAVTGESLAAAIVVQAVLAGASTGLVYLVGTRLRDRATGLLAAALFALDQNLIQNQSTLTAEALLMPAILLAIYALLRYRADGRLRWLLAGAAAIGLAFVTRNVAAIPLAGAAIMWIAWWRRGQVAPLARDLVIIAGAILLASLPIAVATYARDGVPRLTTQLAGLAWTFDGGPGLTIPNTFLVERGILPFDDPGGSAVRVLSDPLPVLWFYATAGPQRVSVLLFFLAPGSTDPLLIADPVIYTNPYGDSITLLRLAGLVLALIAILRTRWWRVAPGIGLVILYTLLYVAVFTFFFPPYHPFRYRIPIEAGRFIGEAAGILLILAAVAQAIPRWRPRVRDARSP